MILTNALAPTQSSEHQLNAMLADDDHVYLPRPQFTSQPSGDA